MSIIKQLNKPPVQADITEWTWKEWFQSVWRILKNFYSDGNTNYSGVGGDVPFIPQSTFHVLAADTADDGVIIEKDSTTNAPELQFRRTSLSAGAKFTNFPADVLGVVKFYGYRSSTPEAWTPAAEIIVTAQSSGGVTGGYTSGQMELQVSNGTTAPDTKVLINTDGNVGLLSGAIPGPANTSYDKVLFSGYHNILVGKTTGGIGNAQLHIASNAEYAADAWSKVTAAQPATVIRADAGSGQIDLWTFGASDTVSLGGTPRYRINSAGNIGVNASIGAANTGGWSKVRYGGLETHLYNTGTTVTNGNQWAHNAEFNANAWNYIANGGATLQTQTDLAFNWYVNSAGLAGGAIAAWTNVASLSTSGLTVITTALTNTITLQDTGGNGANLKFIGNGAVTPNKTIRAQGGNLEWINSGYAAVILTLTDAGALTSAAGMTATVFTTYGGTAAYQVSRRDTGAVAWTIYSSGGSYQLWNGSDKWVMDGSGNVSQGGNLTIGGSQILTTRRTGWAAATNTKSRATFDTGLVTTSALAQRVGALIDDLIAHGIIGA